MKNIRKIAAVLMTLLLCVPFFNVTSAKAAGTARVSIGSASGTVGETVSVTVSIDASFEIGAATIYVSYDTSVQERPVQVRPFLLVPAVLLPFWRFLHCLAYCRSQPKGNSISRP